ncbi:hypothetical protein BDB00DRAFT_611830 [Zychaea mexicana]|uniref:uncharacterized protein n=1 Tax=Zychaea mexicana TaxID=64656 RepID=UPI0022FE185F|nr:uncharacterized protein BDB00DRAFT_611830 [Zychaea mexicana]KAI9489528.1 hypothetical protein BDB00DRAFT_611830 [Zychaea mexicana]
MTAQEDDASPEAVNAITHQDLFMQQHLQQQIEQIASIANISIDKCPTSEVDPDHERQIIHGNYSDDEIIELITEDMQQISINEESTATESANNQAPTLLTCLQEKRQRPCLTFFIFLMPKIVWIMTLLLHLQHLQPSVPSLYKNYTANNPA